MFRDESTRLDSDEKKRLEAGPTYVVLEEPFSTTPYYDFVDSFLLGLKLESYYDSSSECVDALIFTIDDYAYLQNNITLMESNAFMDPLLNITAIIGGNLTAAAKHCFVFGYSVYNVTEVQIATFGTFGDYLLAFLFN